MIEKEKKEKFQERNIGNASPLKSQLRPNDSKSDTILLYSSQFPTQKLQKEPQKTIENIPSNPMSSNGNGKKKNTADCKDEEVDELLRAAQDDMLLKLSLNSHMARFGNSSSSEFCGIDPDLDSRFQALKKTNQPKSKSQLDDAATTTRTEKKNPEKVLRNIDQSDDLLARFTALKGSLPSYSSSAAAGGGGGNDQVRQQLMEDDDDGEDEVEKVIKWAIDAARLDPSPPSESDDDDGDVTDDEDNDTDQDGDGDDDAGKKSKRK